MTREEAAEQQKHAQREQVSPANQSHPENRAQSATTDACDRLYWLLTQAERAGVLVEKEDREAVRMAIDILKKG